MIYSKIKIWVDLTREIGHMWKFEKSRLRLTEIPIFAIHNNNRHDYSIYHEILMYARTHAQTHGTVRFKLNGSVLEFQQFYTYSSAICSGTSRFFFLRSLSRYTQIWVKENPALMRIEEAMSNEEEA